MSDVVFVLGAGASKAAGAPLLDEFLDQSEFEYHNSGNSDNEIARHFELVREAIGILQGVHSKSKLDLKNLESVFTALEMAETLGRIPDAGTEKKDYVSALKNVIVFTIEKSMKFTNKGATIFGPTIYQKFVELLSIIGQSRLPDKTTSVITLNYDIGLDVALYRAQNNVNYGLNGDPKLGNFLPYFKLHGSLNWAVDSESREIIPLFFHDYFENFGLHYTPDSGTCSLNIGRHMKQHFRKKDRTVDDIPLIIPPSWNKADYQRQISPVWKCAAHHLSEARQIYIMGYSMPETDHSFKMLFTLGSQGPNPLRRFCVVNPAKNIESRFLSILGPGAAERFEFLPYTFEEGINHVKEYFIP